MTAAAPQGRQPALRELPLDALLGREVKAPDNRRAGRIEEFHVLVRDGHYEITEFVVGVAGLVERLGVGLRLVFGRRVGGYVVRWDQLDLSDPLRPRLVCPVDELKRL